MNIGETTQFIVNQQAQNVADIHSLQELQRELGLKIDKLHETVKQHEDHHIVTGEMVAKLATWQEDDSERIDWLFESHKKLVEKQDWLMEGHRKLVEAHLRTESKLERFIDEVRKNVTGGNGKRRKNGK